MLTSDEQLQVIKLVKKMILRDRNRRTKLRSFSMSVANARKDSQADWAELRELLKEIG